jgi:hypothetical protein
MKLDHVAMAALVGWYLMVLLLSDHRGTIYRRSVMAPE